MYFHGYPHSAFCAEYLHMNDTMCRVQYWQKQNMKRVQLFEMLLRLSKKLFGTNAETLLSFVLLPKTTQFCRDGPSETTAQENKSKKIY